MSSYSELPIYNSIFFLLKDLYERVPKFGKQYKYLLGEKMLGCCMDSIVLVGRASEERGDEGRFAYVSEIHEQVSKLLTYARLAHELNQLGKEGSYFFLSEKIIDILNQTENWKKSLSKRRAFPESPVERLASVERRMPPSAPR